MSVTELWAAIDIRLGQVVTLRKGIAEDSTFWNTNPLEAADRWQREGAYGLHLVDLDAALDKGSSRHTIETIIQSVSIPTQVGGGIRKQEDVERWLSIGADRVILGTLAYENPGELQKIITTFGPEKIVVALDYKNEMIVTHGWVKERALNVIEAINNLHAVRAGIILATATQLDGMAKGPDLVMVRKIRRLTAMRILASGGIRTMRDIQELEHVGVEGVIAGRALYEGTLRISDVKV